jgi:hypothetical protein
MGLANIPQSLLPKVLESLAAGRSVRAAAGSHPPPSHPAGTSAAMLANTQLKLVQVRSRITINRNPTESQPYQMYIYSGQDIVSGEIARQGS